MPQRSRLALSCFAAVTVLELVAELVGWPVVALICRVLLMPLLIWLCWTTAARRTRLVILVVIALGCCWLGDFAGATVPLKIGFFLLAQIVYILAFRPYWRASLIARPPLLIAYGIACAAVIGLVVVSAGPLAVPAAVYGVSLVVMAVLATGVNRLTGVGGALFLISDIVLAVEFFVAPGAIPYAGFVNMAIYLPAQLMITLGVLQAVSAEVSSEADEPVA
jgi:uncharacterized membrane protein YhhN